MKNTRELDSTEVSSLIEEESLSCPICGTKLESCTTHSSNMFCPSDSCKYEAMAYVPEESEENDFAEYSLKVVEND